MQNYFLSFLEENWWLNAHLLLDEECMCMDKLFGYNQYSLERWFNKFQCDRMFIHIDLEAALFLFVTQ